MGEVPERRQRPHWPSYLYMDEQARFVIDPAEIVVDEEMFRNSAAAVGRNDAPALLFDLAYGGMIDLIENPAVVGAAWSDCEYPERAFSAHVWVDLFSTAGYTHNCRPASRPAEPVILYRGATVDRRFGMSWTTDVAIARQFAYGELRGRPQGHVYSAQVEPAGLLAYLDNERPGEAEYVVDPDYLSDENVRMWEAVPPTE